MDEFKSREIRLEETKERDGLHFTVAAENADSFGTGYAVLYWQADDEPEWYGYFIYELEIEDGDILEVRDVSQVSDISEYTFY